MTEVADTQASLEAVLKDEIIRMYQDVADNPDSQFHFFHGREAAELFDYAPNGSSGPRLPPSPRSPGSATRISAPTSSPARRCSTWAAEPGSTRSSLPGAWARVAG